MKAENETYSFKNLVVSAVPEYNERNTLSGGTIIHRYKYKQPAASAVPLLLVVRRS